MTDDLDPAGRFNHAPACARPPLQETTGQQGDKMATCPGCKRRVLIKALQRAATAGQHPNNDRADRPTVDGDRRRLVIRAALAGIPAGVVDSHGYVQIVRNLDDLDALR